MRSDSRKPSPRSELRLQKYLASCGVGSRRRCEALISQGVVAVDGHVVSEMGVRIPSQGVRVTVRGEDVRPQPLVYLVLHKSPGVLCTSRDPRGRPTFHDFLPAVAGRVYSVGRLDGASEGLLLVTNDGDLAQGLMHPRHEVRKVYRVWTSRPLTSGEIRACRSGLDMDGVRMRMLSVRPLSSSAGTHAVEIVLGEGRNRQIRRMLGACGVGVRRLLRTAYGPLRLGSLQQGQSRTLTHREQAALCKAAGITPHRDRGAH